MTARVATSDMPSRPLAEHGGSTGGRPRAPHGHAARTVLVGLVVAGLAWGPASAAAGLEADPAADRGAASALEYAPGSDVYLVSRTDLGRSGAPAITPDGQRVAFASTALDLAGRDGTGIPSVFLATASTRSSDPFSGTPLLVSRPDRSLPQVPANGPSGEPAVSADGRFVAFTSAASNLVAGGSGGTAAGVYVHDTVEDTTIRVDKGAEAGASSWHPDISDDGRYVVFESDAAALSPGGGGPDAFVADLDADGDGVWGDVAVSRVLADRTASGGLSEPAISGDGQWIVVTAPLAADPTTPTPSPTPAPSPTTAPAPTPTPTPTTELLRVHRQTGAFAQVLAGARTGAVDATGQVVAGVAVGCAGSATVVAAALDDQQQWNVLAVGTEYAVADDTRPVVSADGSRIAFVGAGSDTGSDSAEGTIVRIAAPRWTEASPAGTSCPSDAADVTTVGPGESATLSATGRTVAIAGPGDMSVAARSVVAVDLHTHDGLSVTNTMRTGAIARYVTAAEISGVQSTALLDQAGELARLELGRLQGPTSGLGPALGDLPLDRLALGETVLADLPLELAGLPGGWYDLLPDTPFADDLAELVTLRAIVEWADGLDESESGEEASAATVVRGIRLGDLARLGTPAGELSPASLLLGDVRLAELAIEGPDDPLDAWRSAARAQRLGLEITEQTVLAEADAAGLDLGSIGLENISSADLPSRTPAPSGSTVGEALFSLVTPVDYPWQAFDPAALPSDVPTEVSAADACTGAACGGSARFRFTFDSGPGEPTRFPDAVASVRLPASTAPASISVGESGPVAVAAEQPYAGTVQVDGSLIELPLGDGIAGTTRSISIAYTASRGLGEWVTSAALTADGLVARDAIDPDESAGDAAAGAPEDGPAPVDPASAPLLAESSVRYGVSGGDAGGMLNEGWYRVAPPAAGQRLVLAAGSVDHGLTVTLLEPSVDTTPLGVTARRDAPPRALPGDPGLAVGAGFGTPVAGYDVVDVARSSAGGSAVVDARWSEVDGDGPWLVRVAASGDSAAAGFYGLHVDYSAEEPLPRCTPWTAPPVTAPDAGSGSIDPVGPLTPIDPSDPYLYVGPYGPYEDIDPFGFVDPLDPGSEAEAPAPPTSDDVTAATNTVFVTDFGRMRELYGPDGVDEVLTSIRALDGVGDVGEGAVKGAILTVDGDAGVLAARAALDADPCSVAARQRVVREINRYVAAAIGTEREHIAAIVIVGGDDVVPHAPVSPRGDTIAEVGHAGALRLTGSATAPCSAVPAGTVDPCATPQSAAAAGGFILSDDPYALPDAYPAQGGHLYVPTVGIGRLIDSPDEIRAQLDRFRQVDGVLEAGSLVAAGYGPWSDLPEALSAELSWRTGGGETLLEPGWTTMDAESALSPPDGGDAPGIISLNAVGDERRMISGAAVADEAQEDAALEAEDHQPAPPPAAEATIDPTASPEEFEGALVLSLGCHSGVHLPESVHGDEPHWASTFTAAGAFIGSTGCGLADGTALGPSERLLALYAEWIGVSGEKGPVSAGSALAFAKQSYLATAAQHTAGDERALEQTVFYGVPLYTFRDSTKTAPLAESVDGEGMLRLSPALATVTLTDADGEERVFLTADGQDPLSVDGQPLLPVVVRAVPSADPGGDVARGVLVTGLTSEWREPVDPAVADPGARVSRSATAPAAPPSAAALATLTRQVGPDGPGTVVVATAARLSSDSSGLSRFEVYSDMELEVLYGDSSDAVAPVITATSTGSTFRAVAFDPSASGAVTRALILVAPADGGDGPAAWRAIELKPGNGDDWSAAIPADAGSDYRWVLQVVDDAGNVTTAHSDAP